MAQYGGSGSTFSTRTAEGCHLDETTVTKHVDGVHCVLGFGVLNVLGFGED